VSAARKEKRTAFAVCFSFFKEEGGIKKWNKI